MGDVVSLDDFRTNKPKPEAKPRRISNQKIRRDLDLMPYKDRFGYFVYMHRNGYIDRDQAIRFMGLYHVAKFQEEFPCTSSGEGGL